MIKNSLKQIGSIHVTIIVILITLVLGALGLVLWNNSVRPVAKTSQTQVSNNNTPPIQRTNANTSNNLTLEDWKVEFTVANSLNNTEVKYFKRTSTDSPPRTYYAFITSRIQSLGGKCAERPLGDTVILRRESEKPTVAPDSTWVSDVAVGGYYYILSSPIGTCSGFDENGQMHSPSSIEVEDRAALNMSIKSLAPVQ